MMASLILCRLKDCCHLFYVSLYNGVKQLEGQAPLASLLGLVSPHFSWCKAGINLTARHHLRPKGVKEDLAI